jgi:hypothetical protein
MMVEKLLGMGAKVGLKDKYGKTALILALENSHEGCGRDITTTDCPSRSLGRAGNGSSGSEARSNVNDFK